jgi:hypothetical protein
MSTRQDHRRWADHALGRANECPQTPLGHTQALIALTHAVLALSAPNDEEES